MLQWTQGCIYLLKLVFSFCSHKYPVVELLDHMVVLFLFFWGTSVLFSLFSIVIITIYILTNGAQGFLFSTFSPTLISCLFDNNHSDRCEVISHCGFDLYFPDAWSCWTSFHVLDGHLYVFFGKVSVQTLCLFF